MIKLARSLFPLLALSALFSACAGRPDASATAPASATATPGRMTAGGGGEGEGMSPVDVSGLPAPDPAALGNQPLPFTTDGETKVYTLTTQVARWAILPDVEVGAYTYNGTVPGPMIRLTAGDTVRFVVNNDLPEPTSVHWHGLQIPNDQDGAADVTQPPIQPGETFTYEYAVPDTPGTFFYHTHVEADRQQTLGLYGAYIIEPREPQTAFDLEYTLMLGEWTVRNGQTFPTMDMEGMQPNFFTINGKSYPATETLSARVGQRVLIRLIGSGQFIHPMHLHGQPFTIVGTDGNPVPAGAQLVKDTVLIGPGERYDLLFTARAPGRWLLHCHINHHLTNDGEEVEGGGGLTLIVDVQP